MAGGTYPAWNPLPEQIDAIMKSPKHSVERVSFTDPLGERWQWTVVEGLTERSTHESHPQASTS